MTFSHNALITFPSFRPFPSFSLNHPPFSLRSPRHPSLLAHRDQGSQKKEEQSKKNSSRKLENRKAIGNSEKLISKEYGIHITVTNSELKRTVHKTST